MIGNGSDSQSAPTGKRASRSTTAPVAGGSNDLSQGTNRTHFGFGRWACLAAVAVCIPVLLLWLLPSVVAQMGRSLGLLVIHLGIALYGILVLVTVALVAITIFLGYMGYRRDSQRTSSIVALVAGAGWLTAGVLLIRTVLQWFAKQM